MKKRRVRYSVLSFLLCLCLFALMVHVFTQKVYASGDLDEILNYEITVDVNEDATLHMVYQIDWKVLDSDSEGPLNWVNIGIPNRHYVSYKGLSDTVESVSYSSSGGSNLMITLDRNYYKDEVASFSFELVQDYMYEMNRLSDGETVFEFTPGWFEDIRVDNLTIRWNGEKTTSWSPSCRSEDGYLVWQESLGKGESYTVQVLYPNDAFSFDESKKLQEDYGSYDDSYDSGEDIFSVFCGVILFFFITFALTGHSRRYSRSANFGTETKKKITRTKIEYYPVCQGCGAPRPEGKDNCEYCGRSFIKSQEVVEEKDIPKNEKDILKKDVDGTYRYTHSPNTYIRVHVIPAPAPRRPSGFGGGGSRGGGSRSSGSRGGGHRSGGCACACASSCACACACACAGGGRAGCSTKDFYNTKLKLEYFDE